MNQNPLVSIITVCYNAEALIKNTLESAINQTFKNFELVIIDGGSTDNTVDIAYEFRDYIGTIISEPDKGIYDAMNKGIAAAKGQWLYFLNAGDAFYNNQVLQTIFGLKPNTDCWFIYGKVKTVNEPTGVNYVTGEKIKFNDFYNRYPICHQATFTNIQAFKKVGLYNIHYKLAADTEWFARLFKAEPTRTLFTDEIIAFYDIQGATYHKRMDGYKEYISFGWRIFPFYIGLKNYLFYPLLWLKVKSIRTFSNTKLFKLYRKLKFKNNLS